MASEIFFTNNPAEFTQLEGLIISERNPPGFIQDANLSTVGIGGVTIRGPETPTLVTSASRFVEVFGGRDQGGGGTLENEVWAALINKPFGAIVVRRVAAVDATTSTLEVETAIDGTGAAIARITASSRGLWGQSVFAKVEDASDGDANHWNLRLQYLGEEIVYENLDTTTGNDNLADVVGEDVARWADLTKLADGRPANFSTITEADWEAKDTADDFMALGTTLSAYTTVAGSNGTAVSADYTAAITALANYQGVAIVMMAGASVDQNAMNGQIVTEAASAVDRLFLTWSGTHGQAVATEITNVGTDITTRSDRIVWCYNSTYILDPETSQEVQRPPHEFMASILASNDVDIHPGARQTSDQTAAIRRTNNDALTRADLVALKAAGISTMERLSDAFLFRSGVTTDLTSGKAEITRRRMTDFLQVSAADELKGFVKGKNTAANRAQMAGLLIAFSQRLADQDRVVEAFSIDQASVNTSAQRAQGIEKLLWRVKLIGHMLHLVLETEIGTGVTITEA